MGGSLLRITGSILRIGWLYFARLGGSAATEYSSPGSTNISFAACLLYDPEIEVFSAVDERSAAYMACGLAEETGEPVIISCTGATAARNYVPALTEAFYRKLPIIAVTSSQHFGRVGQHIPQVTDRTNPINSSMLSGL